MTAVASAPSFQPLPPWTSASGGNEGLDSMSAEEVTRMFMPRKSAQRQNSASSIPHPTTPLEPTGPSVSSPAPVLQSNGDTPTTNGDQGSFFPRKKTTRGLWPSSKAEPVSAITTARPQVLATQSSGQAAAASIMSSTLHSQTAMAPSQIRAQSSERQQQNGGRVEQGGNGQAEGTAILALLPMTGTFERKQILLPFFPDTLRIGRQTNAKTIPTANNGYFDSKVLSRQHAETWADRHGKIWIRDVKSSNGTFVNGTRLSPENKDSEPHELREQDTLELGIDIVSEDQKSIVHHKVSAKVELAGIYSNAPNIMDVIHVDPNTGQSFQAPPVGQPASQLRGRTGSQGSIVSNGRLVDQASVAGSGSGLLGVQRQMNMWMGPITVEQVVRKLTLELRQAKAQSQNLHRTGDFFTKLMTLGPGEEVPKSPQKIEQEERDARNGASIPKQDVLMSPDPLSPFTQPPMPPPSQPLPEKPDAAIRSIATDPVAGQQIRRVDTEKPGSESDSPTRLDPQNGQIVSLLEALKSVKQESDSQGDRIKHLELALKRERRAREMAERRARAFSKDRSDASSRTEVEDGSIEEAAFDPPLDSIELLDHHQGLPNGHMIEEEGEGKDDVLRASASMETLRETDEPLREAQEIGASASRLQARLDLMVKEMDEMKFTMESYKRRAEDAEEGRRSLAEMVENIRAGRDPQQNTTNNHHHHNNTKDFNSQDSTLIGSDSTNGDFSPSRGLSTFSENAHSFWPSLSSSSPSKRQAPNGTVSSGDMQRELERTLSNVLQQQRPGENGRIAQSAPYVSMVGVVLIGVGIMTWLNGWQPGGDSR